MNISTTAAIVILVAVIFSVGVAIKTALDIPIVEMSYSTGRCVRVWTPQGDGSCDTLPEKYEYVWVE